MFDRPQSGERTILVHLIFSKSDAEDEEITEFKLLAESAGADVIEIFTSSRDRPDAKYFMGSGKAKEIAAAVELQNVQLVIVNHELSPGQERNLEKLFKARVVDRTGLILDIFAARAQTFAGKLQVELAQLQHISTRLIRGWTHLERQKGGIGLRGPGETQLESDRRLIKGRIKQITSRLEKVRHQRALSSHARKRAQIPTISLVGYTNAGKSTLFNQLLGAEVYAADQLFATLDPTLRRLEFKDFGPVIVADTVGFIRDLPHELIESFHATLEQIREADLLIHVIDALDEQRHFHANEVNKVLKIIKADQVPKLEVYNKIDGLIQGEYRIEKTEDGIIKRVCVSARENKGMPLLIEAIKARLSEHYIFHQVQLKPNQGAFRAKLYELGCVLAEYMDSEGHFNLSLRLSQEDFARMFG